VRGLAARSTRLLPTNASERSLASRARRLFEASALPLADRIARWNSFFEPRSILRSDVVRSLGDAVDAPIRWQREVFALARGEELLSRILEHNFRTYLPWDLLVKADRTSMAHSLETRSPFLDTELIEYAARLPASYLRRGRETKRILKHAFRRLLPKEIAVRGKMGFGVPLGAWFRTDLQSYLRDHLEGDAAIFDYLDRGAVATLLSDHFAVRSDNGQRLWALLTLELWLRSMTRQDLACAA
jgi:asparagine synthase (glutamine-hydrolysing)